VLLVVVWPFFPESPYWLVHERRFDDAKKSLQRTYGFDDEAFYDIEIRRLKEDVVLCEDIMGEAKSQRKTVLGFIPLPTAELECFEKKNLKRTLTSICAGSSQQVIGAAFVIGNATYFLDLIGVKEFFDAAVVLYVVMLLSSAAAFPLSEIFVRSVTNVYHTLCSIKQLTSCSGPPCADCAITIRALLLPPSDWNHGLYSGSKGSWLGDRSIYLSLGHCLPSKHWSYRIRIQSPSQATQAI
jgi:hypothetical protein